MDTGAGRVRQVMTTVLTGWNAMRWLRLALALAFLFAAIDGNEPLAYAAAILFGSQAILNVSCCGPVCTKTEASGSPAQKVKELTYEEIK